MCSVSILVSFARGRIGQETNRHCERVAVVGEITNRASCGPQLPASSLNPGRLGWPPVAILLFSSTAEFYLVPPGRGRELFRGKRAMPINDVLKAAAASSFPAARHRSTLAAMFSETPARPPMSTQRQ